MENIKLIFVAAAMGDRTGIALVGLFILIIGIAGQLIEVITGRSSMVGYIASVIRCVGGIIFSTAFMSLMINVISTMPGLVMFLVGAAVFIISVIVMARNIQDIPWLSHPEVIHIDEPGFGQRYKPRNRWSRYDYTVAVLDANDEVLEEYRVKPREWKKAEKLQRERGDVYVRVTLYRLPHTKRIIKFIYE